MVALASGRLMVFFQVCQILPLDASHPLLPSHLSLLSLLHLVVHWTDEVVAVALASARLMVFLEAYQILPLDASHHPLPSHLEIVE